MSKNLISDSRSARVSRKKHPKPICPLRSILERLRGPSNKHSQQLHENFPIMIQSPTQRGNQFLLNNAKDLTSTTDTGLAVRDNFSQLLIYEATGNLYSVLSLSFILQVMTGSFNIIGTWLIWNRTKERGTISKV
jgi:hypothetical protein